MIRLNYILFFSLISLTLLASKIEHCIHPAKICKSVLESLITPTSVPNCIKGFVHFPKLCATCNIGYAASYSGEECIPYPFCIHLEKGNKECDECYPGYYWNGEKCAKIPIEYCLEGDDTGCFDCAGFTKKINDGEKCELVEPFMEGCSNYVLNGICNDCEIGYDKISRESESEGVTCTFKPCADGDTELEYCPNCEDGYYTDFVNDGKCKPYTTEDHSKINEVRYALLILMIILL